MTLEWLKVVTTHRLRNHWTKGRKVYPEITARICLEHSWMPICKMSNISNKCLRIFLAMSKFPLGFFFHIQLTLRYMMRQIICNQLTKKCNIVKPNSLLPFTHPSIPPFLLLTKHPCRKNLCHLTRNPVKFSLKCWDTRNHKAGQHSYLV